MALETVYGIEQTQLMTQKSASKSSVMVNDFDDDDCVQIYQTPGNRKRDKLKIRKQVRAANRAEQIKAETIKDKKLRLEIEAVQKSVARFQQNRKERNAQKRMHANRENGRRSEEPDEERRCRLDSMALRATERKSQETEDERIARL